jgi:hypothetical protein
MIASMTDTLTYLEGILDNIDAVLKHVQPATNTTPDTEKGLGNVSTGKARDSTRRR